MSAANIPSSLPQKTSVRFVAVTVSLLLIAALLSAQWTSPHIHLAVQHSHDAGLHQHPVNHHYDQTAIDYADSNHASVSLHDVDMHNDLVWHHAQSVDLNFSAYISARIKHQPVYIMSSVLSMEQALYSEVSLAYEGTENSPFFLRQTPLQPRAPPPIS